jgi:signal transduction histidine kinase
MKLKAFFDSIAFRISLSIAIVVAASMAVVGGLLLREERKTLETELQKEGVYLATIISNQVIEPLLYEERHDIYSLLKASMIDKDSLIVYAEIYDKNGKTVVKALKDERFSKTQLPPYDFETPADSFDIKEDNNMSVYHISLPVNVEKYGTIGFLRMGITKEFLYSMLEKVKQKLYFLTAAVTFIGIMLGLYMARKVLNPVLILSKGVKMVAEGEVGVEVPVVGHGEIKDLSLSFNRMSVKLKELFDKIKSAQEHLVKTEKFYAIGEFSAGIAHEIKNPLTPIKMLMNTAKKKNKFLTDKDISVIEEEINRIDNIVKEFLAFARPDKAEKTKIKINDILKEVITITRPKMEQSSIRLVEKYLKLDPEITGNHDSLEQVFLNIMLNAIQAMDSQGGTLTVKTSTEKGNLQVAINDTGIGIPKEDAKKAFDPFFTTKKEGTGMGLAITYNIINDHSGKIDIDSTPGIGTTVKVVLPL